MKLPKSALPMAAAMVLAVSSLAQAPAQPASAPQQAPAAQHEELRRMLTEFLSAAGRGDIAVFDRFFADDLVYTRFSGEVITKKNIMDGLRNPPPRKPGEPTVSYSGEDVRFFDHGDVVVVNFRLVQNTASDNRLERQEYRNTGVFRKRNGKWQVVAWQATKLPPPEKQGS